MVRYAPGWLRLLRTTDGVSSCGPHKAFRFEDNVVTWCLVSLMELVLAPRRQRGLRVSKEIKRYDIDLAVYCKHLGLDFDEISFPSSKQWRALHARDGAEMPTRVVDVQTLTSMGTLVAYISWIARSRGVKRKAELFELFVTFLTQVVASGWLDSGAAQDGLNSVDHCQCIDRARGGDCPHVQAARASLQEPNSHRRVATYMVTLAKHMWACAQCRDALSCILKALGCHVDQRADDIVFFDDCRSFSQFPWASQAFSQRSRLSPCVIGSGY